LPKMKVNIVGGGGGGEKKKKRKEGKDVMVR
jgi:hypothetical protein